MSIYIHKTRYRTKRDQQKTKEYVYIEYQDPEAPKRKKFSCGEVHNPESWIRAEQRLQIIFARKLRQALDKLQERKRDYIQEEV